MDGLFINYLTLWRPLGYVIVFFGMFVEGEALLFISSFLAHAGFFDAGDLAIIAIAGALIGDSAWFWLGRRASARSNLITRLAERLASPFDAHIQNRTLHAIFLSKFAYGFNHAILLRAGMLNLDVKKIITADVLATAVWAVIVGSAGYFSGSAFLTLKHYFKFAEFIPLAIFLVFLIGYTITTKQIKKGF